MGAVDIVTNTFKGVSSKGIWTSALDTLNSASGPDGSIRASLGQINGFGIYVFFYMILLGAIFSSKVYKIASGEGEPGDGGKAFIWSLIAALSSYIYFKNASTSVLMIMAFAGIVMTVKFTGNNVKFGSSSEKRAMKGIGINPGMERRIVKGAEGTEKQEHGKVWKFFHRIRHPFPKKDEKIENTNEDEKKQEGMLVAENAEMEEHLAAFAGGAEEIAQVADNFFKDEISAEERNRQIENTIKKIDEELSQINPEKQLDEAAVNTFNNAAQKLVDALKKFKESEGGTDKELESMMKVIEKVIKMSKSALNHAKTLDKRSIVHERRLMSIGSKELKNLVEYQKNEEKAFQQIYRQTNQKGLEPATQRAIGEQIKAMRNEIKQGQDNVAILQNMDTKFKALLNLLRNDLKKVKADLSDLINSEKNIENIETYNDMFNKEIQKLSKAFTEQTDAIEKDARELTHEDNMSPMQIAALGPKYTADVGRMYQLLKDIKAKKLAFEEEGMIKFILAYNQLLEKAFHVQESLEFISRAYYRLIDGYKQVDDMALKLMKGKTEIDKELHEKIASEIMDQRILKREVSMGEHIKGAFVKVHGDLAKTKEDLDKDVAEMKKDLENAQDLQIKTVKILTSILHRYFEMRKGDYKEIKADYTIEKRDVSDAKTKLKDVRSETLEAKKESVETVPTDSKAMEINPISLN